MTLPFLDVLVEKKDLEFVTSIYRKPTFTGQYIRWNSFCPMKRTTSLISTLFHRALVICSKSTLENELSYIRWKTFKLKLPFLLLDNIFYKTLHAHVNIMITNFLFLPVAVLLFIFPPLKPRTSKHPKQMQTKGIRLWSKNHTLVSAPYIGRFFYQSR